MGLKFNIDAAAMAAAFKELALEVERDLMKGVGELAAATYGQAKLMANAELKSSQQTFEDNCWFEEISPGVWVVGVKEPALWIEEGIKPGTDMKPSLLKNAETSEKNVKYKVIPFEHTKPKTQMTPVEFDLASRIKAKLKESDKNKTSKNKDGSPKRHFDFGGEIPGKGNTPIMNGVRVYQKATKKGNVRGDIFTFRTVTADQNGKWIHPGVEGGKYLDRALEWAMKEWEDTVLPGILEKYKDEK